MGKSRRTSRNGNDAFPEAVRGVMPESGEPPRAAGAKSAGTAQGRSSGFPEKGRRRSHGEAGAAGGP